MAVAATTVYEIRTGGNDANGGGFNAARDAVNGVDYTLQDAAQLSLTDLACASNTTLTSATGGFTAAMVGNLIHIVSGTNAIAGWYEITARADTNTVTIDRTCATGGNMTSGVGSVGGALASIGGLGAVLTTAGGGGGVAGITAYIRGGTYNLVATAVNTPTGPLDLDETAQDSLRFYLKGYSADATRDAWTGTRPVIDCATKTPANAHVIEAKGGTTTNFHVIAFLEIDGDDLTVDGIYGQSSAYDRAINCICHHCDTAGFTTLTCIQCYSHTNVGFGFNQCSPVMCRSSSNTSFGFYYSNAVNCIADGNGSDGFQHTAIYSYLCGCVSVDNGSDGFHTSFGDFINCISYSNAGYEYNTAYAKLFNCASGDVTSGRYPAAAPPLIDIGKVELTGDPFVDRTNATLLSRDFNLLTTGGGLQCRAAGLDPYGQTGALDIGAVQHADPTLPAVEDVESGVQYGAGGTEFTGTLVVGGRASHSLTLAKETGAAARGGSGTCAKLSPTATATYGYWYFYVPVTASTAFTMTLYYNATSGFNGEFKVSIYDTDHTTFLDESRSVAGTYDGTWRQYAGHEVTPAATGMCLVRVEVKQGAHSGSDVIYIDDIAGV